MRVRELNIENIARLMGIFAPMFGENKKGVKASKVAKPTKVLVN